MFHNIPIIKNSPSLFAVPLFEAKSIRNFGAAVFGVGEANLTDFCRTWAFQCRIRQLWLCNKLEPRCGRLGQHTYLCSLRCHGGVVHRSLGVVL
jgi:hypothetical protein